MAKSTINLGTSPNDRTGDTLRDAGTKVNSNFSELYTALGNGTALGIAVTGATSGQVLKYNGTSFVPSTDLNTDAVTSVNTLTGAVVLTADSIAEAGTPTNLYFTNARARAAVSAGTGIGYSSSTGVITLSATSDNLTEGTTNLFYTSSRFNTSFGQKTTNDLAEGNVNKYFSSRVAGTDYVAPNTNPTLTGVTFSGSVSAPAWTTSGIRHISVAGTLTDTTSTGTVATAYTNNFGGNTIAATNATTFTTYSTTFINSPTAGTNVTITNPYSLITAGNILVGSTGTSTITAVAATATATSTAASLGYLGIPQSATATTATLAIGDAGKHIYVTTAAQTITIPANATVAYPIGTTIGFIAGASATTVTIAITSDTMYLGGTGTTGSRTLAAHGMATAVKVAATTWYISGYGLT
jgi:hypothetical protein